MSCLQLRIALATKLERSENMQAKPTTEQSWRVTYLIAGVFPIYFFWVGDPSIPFHWLK